MDLKCLGPPSGFILGGRPHIYGASKKNAKGQKISTGHSDRGAIYKGYYSRRGWYIVMDFQSYFLVALSLSLSCRHIFANLLPPLISHEARDPRLKPNHVNLAAPRSWPLQTHTTIEDLHPILNFASCSPLICHL